MRIMVLNDGETYTDVAGCKIIELPNRASPDAPEDIEDLLAALRKGEAPDHVKVEQTFGSDSVHPFMDLSTNHLPRAVFEELSGIPICRVIRHEYGAWLHVPLDSLWDEVEAAIEGNPACSECGSEVFLTATGVAHHGEDEDSIDHDADADHVALPEFEYEEGDVYRPVMPVLRHARAHGCWWINFDADAYHDASLPTYDW